MNEQPDKKPKRRLWQFSLRTMLILFLGLTIFVALNVERWREYWNATGRSVPASFDIRTGRNVLWTAKLGSVTHSSPVVSAGKVFIGSNNGSGYLNRFPANVDLGVMLCFDAKTGKFLWQHSNQKLKTGRVHDYPLQGVTGSATVEADRLYYVSNRCELVCLDTEGYLDGEDDGEVQDPKFQSKKQEADVVWKLDMMGELNVNPHNAAASIPCIAGDRLFVVTGEGVGMTHTYGASVNAPSFLAVDKHTGKILWTDSSPGTNVLHGQWGSPEFGVLGGVPQVIFPGGDGWLYSFSPAGNADGSAKLLWKFDCNPKTSVWKLGGAGTRNNLIQKPTIAGGLVYMAVGQDPEHGEGQGRVWCIDPTKRGDVSAELVVNESSPNFPIPHKRNLAADISAGDMVKANPNSAVVWEYTGTDLNGDGKFAVNEKMHRSLSRVVVHGDHVYVVNYSGFIHCVDNKTGQAVWTYDLLALTWSSPIVSDTHLLIGDEDGDVAAFPLVDGPKAATPEFESNLRMTIFSTPTISNDVMYIANKRTLYAIAAPKTTQKKDNATAK